MMRRGAAKAGDDVAALLKKNYYCGKRKKMTN
jgi:hypothetical protein